MSPRPREFDRQEALDKALGIFWKKGFESTSVQDLVDTMGVNRASLYDTFGNKKSIFTEAMDRYMVVTGERLLFHLQSPVPFRAAIENFLTALVENHCDETGDACLMVKAAVAVCGRDEDTGRQIRTFFDGLEEEFFSILDRAQQHGELGPSKNPRGLARFLTSTVQGVVVSSCVHKDRERLSDTVQAALSILD